ncbi:MAG: AgmX/PglI C-terminal domain-containing protein, partial [Polyangiales bacterium]
KGRLSVSFTIKPNGRVADAKSLGGTLKDTALIGCSLDVIGRTRFPKPRKQSAKVTLPLQFTR